MTNEWNDLSAEGNARLHRRAQQCHCKEPSHNHVTRNARWILFEP
jgi:hypothetical protein